MNDLIPALIDGYRRALTWCRTDAERRTIVDDIGQDIAALQQLESDAQATVDGSPRRGIDG